MEYSNLLNPLLRLLSFENPILINSAVFCSYSYRTQKKLQIATFFILLRKIIVRVGKKLQQLICHVFVFSLAEIKNNIINSALREQTIQQYQDIIASCKGIFEKKTKDYGTSWRILRLSSITDQIYIKAQRIRSIQEKGTQKINEDIESEFIGIINYCIIGLVQMQLTENDPMEISYDKLEPKYDHAVNSTLELLTNKNHDYGEAWREMRVSSMTDIILMKLFRVKQIEDNSGKTIISEGVDANYQDIINYSVFCLIKLMEQKR